MYPTETDLSGLYGQRIDNVGTSPNWTSGLQTWSILVKNATYSPNVPIADRTSYYIDRGDITITMKGSFLNQFDSNVLRRSATQNVNPTFHHQLPQFKYDASLNKIYFERASWWDCSYGLKIVMNNRLKNLMSFSEYRIKDFGFGDFKLYFPQSTTAGNAIYRIPFTDKLKGEIIAFPAKIESLYNGTTEYDSWEKIDYYESFQTSYIRNMVNTILLTSGFIATQGEVVGNGASVRKVITDFVLDPSSNIRDYLVYEPSIIRYYPLIANHPLYKVDVNIMYKDVFGIIRRLTIEPSMVASVKIEFRPNNMIQNYS